MNRRVIFPPTDYFTPETPMTETEIRAAAVLAAATFCAPCEQSTADDVRKIARQLADYIRAGS